jgi:hypothetical protein
VTPFIASGKEERLMWEITRLNRLNAELIETIRLVAPLVNTAVDMYNWESSTDYPNGDPAVQRARQAFHDALFELQDLHYNELDIFDEVLGNA